MRVHPESGVVLSDKGDWPLLWEDPPGTGDSIASLIDQDTVLRAWQLVGSVGGDQSTITSVGAGMQSAWLRFLFPLRDKNIPLERIADTMREGILEMMQQLERVELVGWGAPPVDRVDGQA